MAIIELGLDFSGAQTEAELARTPAPAGLYTLIVREIKLEESKAGRPRLTWLFEIIEHPEYSGKKMRHFTPLPVAGDLSGVGFLTDTVTALGRPWVGVSFDTDDYLGSTCLANVTVDDDGKWNNIASFA